MVSVGGVVGSPHPHAATSMLPSTKILFTQASPDPGGGSTSVGDEFTGTAAKSVNLSPATKSVWAPGKDTFNVPPKSIALVALSRSELRVAPLLLMSTSVVPRKVRDPSTVSGPVLFTPAGASACPA